MKKAIAIILLTSSIALLFHSCETEGTYEINDKLVTVDAKLEYLTNQDARYRIAFGEILLADTLPRVIDASQGILSTQSKVAYVKEQDLTKDLKVWRLEANGTETLELETKVTAAANGTISLLQLSDESPLTYFKPIYPPENKTTQTMTQFFYSEATQPAKVNVSILAVDYYSLLLAGNNLNNVTGDKKTIIGEFTLSKGKLSDPIILDLDIYNGSNNNLAAQFFYKITDAQTGTVIQNYATNTKIAVNTKTSSLPLNPKYKFTLFQWKYQSATIPFKAPTSLINNEEW